MTELITVQAHTDVVLDSAQPLEAHDLERPSESGRTSSATTHRSRPVRGARVGHRGDGGSASGAIRGKSRCMYAHQLCPARHRDLLTERKGEPSCCHWDFSSSSKHAPGRRPT